MNATAKWILCGASLGLAVAASPATAAPLVLPLGLAMASGATAASDNKAQEAALLAQARSAIKAGQFAEAERLIREAEALQVEHDPLRAPFQDSPQKLRRELQQRAAAAPQTPSSRFSAWPPAAGQSEQPAPPQNAQVHTPRTNEAMIDRMAGDAKSRAARHLENGRKALGRGDVTSALSWYNKARAENASFAQGEYSPAQLAGELLQAGVPEARLAATPAPAPAFNIQQDPPAQPRLGSAFPAAAPQQTINPYAAGAATSPDRGDDRFPLAQGAAAAGNAAVQSPMNSAGQGAIAPRRLPNTDAQGHALGQAAAPMSKKQEALQLVARAQMALDRGDAAQAKQLALQAQNLRVDDREFGPGQTRPWDILLQADRALRSGGGNYAVQQATHVENANHMERGGYAVERSIYDPAQDRTRLMAANADQAPGPAQVHVQVQGAERQVPGAPPVFDGNFETAGPQFYDAAMKAFGAGDRAAALDYFKQAYKYREQLDPRQVSQVKDKLQALDAPPPQNLPPGGAMPLTQQLDEQTRLLQDKLLREISITGAAADRLRQSDPDAALQKLRDMRQQVAAAEVSPDAKKRFLSIVDRNIDDMERYVEENRSTIELDRANRRVKEGIANEQAKNLENQAQLGQLVDDFNKALDERRFNDAEALAKQAREIAPELDVVQNMIWKSQFAKEIASSMDIEERKQRGVLGQLGAVDEASIPFDDRFPIQFTDPKQWKDLTGRRQGLREQLQRRMSPAEREIQAALEKPVDVNFVNRPLSDVMDTLGKMANVNIYLDPQGLLAEGVTTETVINLDLGAKPVMLKSALALILDQLRLSFVIEHETLKITSRQASQHKLTTVTYYVADLVIPIPNFTPSYNMGLASAIQQAHQTIGFGAGFGANAAYMFADNQQSVSPLALDKQMLAQVGPTGSMAGRPMQSVSGPGGLGGAAAADFDSLIDLVTNTVHPNSWKEGGTGEGTIEPFPTNLSIVVSQTEEVHAAIADLLEQLRRLQDLQVTIEVRFITLNDNFFERIGIDFDFNIDDNSGGIAVLPDDTGPSITLGLDPTGQPTANRDLQFTQSSFSTAIPQFGGFDPATAANFGFAILSDIEVFFLLQASMGDTRTNVLQAPKVTLFNGQQATISDNVQRPFVTSVVPVVGDFAAAHQPVIVVLSEGTSLNVQAVVSDDKRFVRLTLVPFFSQIGDVEEFTFTGSTTTNSGTAIVDPTNPGQTLNNDESTTTEGTTVQLPTFAFTTVTTTVSVPDGGTVLLGGIKRLSEGRTERGVPLLSKIPYANRLFKNVGIGRTTQSLMMMVTPRIIIQEEEENRLLGVPNTP